MVSSTLQFIVEVLQSIASAGRLFVLGITEPVVNLLSNPFPGLRNLSENWQIAIFSTVVLALVSVGCVILSFFLPRMFPEKKAKEEHNPYFEDKSSKPIELANQFKKNILEDPRNSNK